MWWKRVVISSASNVHVQYGFMVRIPGFHHGDLSCALSILVWLSVNIHHSAITLELLEPLLKEVLPPGGDSIACNLQLHCSIPLNATHQISEVSKNYLASYFWLYLKKIMILNGTWMWFHFLSLQFLNANESGQKVGLNRLTNKAVKVMY